MRLDYEIRLAGGETLRGSRVLELGAKALALTGLEVLTQPELLEKIKERQGHEEQNQQYLRKLCLFVLGLHKNFLFPASRVCVRGILFLF